MVVATRTPTFTCALLPNSTPLGLSKKTLPVAFSFPKMSDGWLPVTRLSATPPLGCTKLTLAALPMLKLSQLAIRRCWLCVTVMALPFVAMLPAAAPPTICPMVGRVFAGGAASVGSDTAARQTASAKRRRLKACRAGSMLNALVLPWPWVLAHSEATMKAARAALQTMRKVLFIAVCQKKATALSQRRVLS